IGDTRWLSQSSQGKAIRRGARGSVRTVARWRVKPSGSSMAVRRTTPASEDSRPPSQSRSTALPPTGARRSGVGCLGGVLSAGIASQPELVEALGRAAFMRVHSFLQGYWVSYYRTLGVHPVGVFGSHE